MKLTQNFNIRVLWLATAWGFSLTNRPSTSICFLILGITGTKFNLRSRQVSVIGILLSLLILLHPLIAVFFNNQPQLWTQDWLPPSVGFVGLISVLLGKRRQIQFDSPIKYAVMVTCGIGLIVFVTAMTLETRLWVLGTGYDNSTHFRDMFESISRPIISPPFPSLPPKTFAVVTSLFLRIAGVSSDTPTSDLLLWYLVSLLALIAAFFYVSFKVIARNVQSKIILSSSIAALVFFIFLTPVSHAFVSGNPTQLFAIVLVLYYLYPVLLSQLPWSQNLVLIAGCLYMVNSGYQFTLILLAPLVVVYLFQTTITHNRVRQEQNRIEERPDHFQRKTVLIVVSSLMFILALSQVGFSSSGIGSRALNQFKERFSLDGGIEPYKTQMSYALICLFLGLLIANFVVLRTSSKISSTSQAFHSNIYLCILGISGLLVALVVSKYSETIRDGGTYYAMKLNYSAAIIAFVAVTASAGSLLQALLSAPQDEKFKSNLMPTKRFFLFGMLLSSALLVSGGFALVRVSQQQPKVFKQAYMGAIPKFISEFNNPGSSGIDSHLVAYAARESKRLNRPIFLVTSGTANALGTIWANEISGFWSYPLWESINHVPQGLSVGDINLVADFFEDLEMILITDDETLLIKLRSEVPTLLGCTLNKISVGTCELQKLSST